MEMNIPYEKLDLFREKLALGNKELSALAPYREAFGGKSKEFSDYMDKVFSDITETKIIMERMDDPARLRSFWRLWFEKLFGNELNDDFIAFLWRIGMRHVEVGLDQRFSNLGFSVVRRFFQQIVETDIPPEKRYDVAVAIDKLIDFCLLVETSAYISATTRCDIELIKGIADRIRNKITIIGGYIRLLQKKAPPGDAAYDIYANLINESTMCEHMVKDINVYNDIFQRVPEFQNLKLKDLLDVAIERLKPEEKFPDVRLTVDLDPDASTVSSDPRDIKHLLYYTLENALEFAGGGTPNVRVSTSKECPPEHFVCVEIFNSGAPPKKENVEKFFSPFYTTKAEGSGFGVPISALAARKNFGNFIIEPADDGTRVIVTLPASISAAG
jgi:signal transduction histidine kinase